MDFSLPVLPALRAEPAGHLAMGQGFRRAEARVIAKQPRAAKPIKISGYVHTGMLRPARKAVPMVASSAAETPKGSVGTIATGPSSRL